MGKVGRVVCRREFMRWQREGENGEGYNWEEAKELLLETETGKVRIR